MKAVFIPLAVLIFGVVSCGYSQESIDIAVYSGSDPKTQVYQAHVGFDNDGFIKNYAVDWLGKSSMKNLSYSVIRKSGYFLIHENNSNQDLWEIQQKDNHLLVSYKGKQIASGELVANGFFIDSAEGGNLIKLKISDLWELVLEKDTYTYSKNGGKIRRLFSAEDGVVVSEKKLISGAVEISELADYGSRQYQIKGTIASKGPLQMAINTIVFSQNFIEEGMPFLWGSK
jgi:hypothetical protein